MTAADKRNAISTAVKRGTSSSQGLMVKVLQSPSANEVSNWRLEPVWHRLTTRKMVKVMTNDGTVVMSM